MSSLLSVAISDHASAFTDILDGTPSSFPRAKTLFLKLLDGDDVVSATSGENDVRYLSFLRDVLVCMLRLLVKPDFQEHSASIVELVQRMLAHVGRSDFPVFSSLAHNLVGLLLELSKGFEEFPNGVHPFILEDAWIGAENPTPAKMRRIDDDDDDDQDGDDNVKFAFFLKDEDEADLLHLGIFTILEAFHVDMSDSQPRLLNILWQSVIHTIEKSPYPVKSCALLAAASLLRIRGLPGVPLADALVRLLFVLLDAVLGAEEGEEEDEELSGEMLEAQVPLAACLDGLSSLATPHPPPSSPSLSFFHETIVDDLKCLLGSRPLWIATSSPLKFAVCRLLTRVIESEIRRKPEGSTALPFKEVIQLQLFGFLAKCVNSDKDGASYLIPFMSLTITETLTVPFATVLTESDATQSSRITQGGVPLNATASPLYEKLYHKLQDQIHKLLSLVDGLRSPASDATETFVALRRHILAINVVLGVVAACVDRLSRRSASQAAAETSLKLWISDSVVSSLLTSFLELMSSMASQSESIDAQIPDEMFGLVLKSIGLLLVPSSSFSSSADDSATFPSRGSLLTMARILLVPWIKKIKSKVPMDKEFEGPVYQFSQTISSPLSPRHLRASLSLLSLVPKTDYLDLRREVFHRSLRSPDSSIAALESFPLLMHGAPDAFRKYVIASLLTPLLGATDAPPEFAERLPDVFGSVVCVFAERARPEMRLTDDGFVESRIRCSVCDVEGRDDDDSSFGHAPRLLRHDLKWIEPFISSFSKSPSPVTRLGFVRALRRVFAHVRVAGQLDWALNASLALLIDPDRGVRDGVAYLLAAVATVPRLLARVVVKKGTGNGFAHDEYFSDPKLIDPVVAALEKAAKTQFSDPDVLATILHSAAKYGAAYPGGPPRGILKILLSTLTLTKEPEVAAGALNCLDEAFGRDKEASRAAFRRHQESLCHLLIELLYNFVKVENSGAEQLVDASANKSAMDNTVLKSVGDEVLQRLHAFATALGFPAGDAFVRQNQKFLVPRLIKHKGDEASLVVLQQLAKLLGLFGKKEIIINNFKHIFSYLILNEEEEEEEKNVGSILNYIATTTEIELTSFILMNVAQIRNLLLIRICSHGKQVFSGLRVLMANEKREWAGRTITDEDLTEYLGPNLLGTFTFFDSLIKRADVLEEAKREVFESLTNIVELVGPKHITPHRVKLMTMLKNGLASAHQKRTLLVLVHAWNTFVRNVRLQDLAKILVEVTTHLLPLLRRHPDPKEVGAIYHFLLVENADAFAETMGELYFLTECELDEEVKESVRRAKGDGEGIEAEISKLLKGVSHENKDVRVQTLNQLHGLLVRRRQEIRFLVTGNEVADPVVSRLVSTLHNGCQASSDRQIRLGLAKCLGELGAIDPGKLDLHNDEFSSKGKRLHDLPKNVYSVKEPDVQIAFMNELVQAYSVAEDTMMQDRAAYAIQEMIKVMTKLGSKNWTEMWKAFSPDAQEVLRNHEKSCYTQTAHIDSKSFRLTPMYGSRLGSSFRSWICNWAFKMIHHNLDRGTTAFRLFEPCSVLLSARLECAIFFLPSLVLHCLLGGVEAVLSEIGDEIKAILTDVTSGDASSPPHSAPSDRNLLSRTASRDALASASNSKKDLRSLAAQTVFRVLDYVRAWQNFRLEELTASQGAFGKGGGGGSHKTDRAYRSVESFFRRIPKDLIAKAALASNSPTRALMYFEEHIHWLGPVYNMSKRHEDLGFLLRIYSSLDEPDGVQGLDQIRQSELSLMDRIYVFESGGNHLDASVCYEDAIAAQPLDVRLQLGLLRCFVKMGQLSSVLSQVEGLVAKRPDWEPDLMATRIECAWKLGQWDNLANFLDVDRRRIKEGHDGGVLSGSAAAATAAPVAAKFEFNLGKIFAALQSEDRDEFEANLMAARLAEIGPLSVAAMETGSYNSGYQHVVKLQALNEMEFIADQFIFPRDSPAESLSSSLESALSHLSSRFDLVQPSYRHHDCLLTFRRALFSLVSGKATSPELRRRVEQEIGQTWLRLARSARLSGHYQASFVALNSARAYDLLEFPMERAKLLSSTGKKTEALNFLEKRMSSTFHKFRVADSRSDSRSDSRADAVVWDYGGNRQAARVHAETHLLHARFKDELDLVDLRSQWPLFRAVTHLEGGADWEKAYYATGKCLQKHLKRQQEVGEPSGKYNLLSEIFRYYLACLRHGSQFFYQTLPFVFEKWFELASKVAEMEESLRKNPAKASQTQKGGVAKITTIFLELTENYIDQIVPTLQPYQLLVVFPQLISRICHSSNVVFTRLTKIIVHVMKAFPQQTFWQMVQVSNSSSQRRRQRYEEITRVFKQETTEENWFLLKVFSSLSDHLIKICQHKPEGEKMLSLTRHFRPLESMIKSAKFPRIILPFQDSLYPLLPSDATTQNREHSEHRPFPATTVYIQSFRDSIEVLKSLQKPKKVEILGSDGKTYSILCKAEDDLRKDSRFLEFNGIVNKCLRKDPSTRQKELYIRTYAVIPLSEKAGIVEWIPDLTAMRKIILKLHREEGTGLEEQETARKTREWNKAPADSEARKKIFRELFAGHSPPVFHLHFPRTFSEPSQWYRARTNYARTTAVMSMVGFVVGLGDRHGENILCDTTNGDAVHVDFDCLFNKGETLKVPENIPFRLTQNVVDGFGPMGIEGVFRCACEATLRVMREEQEALLSAMTAFLYDPLVEWTRDGKRKEAPSKTVPESGEFKENTLAVESLEKLKQRLRGEGRHRLGMPLSVEGQVQDLLKDATDLKKLELMYIGWAPYI